MATTGDRISGLAVCRAGVLGPRVGVVDVRAGAPSRSGSSQSIGRGQKTSVGRAAFLVVRRGRRARGTKGGLFQVLRAWEMEAKEQLGRNRGYLVSLNIRSARWYAAVGWSKVVVLGAEAAAIVDGETGRYVGPDTGTARESIGSAAGCWRITLRGGSAGDPGQGLMLGSSLAG